MRSIFLRDPTNYSTKMLINYEHVCDLFGVQHRLSKTPMDFLIIEIVHSYYNNNSSQQQQQNGKFRQCWSSIRIACNLN